ncbi:MAG: pseudouridine synthase [Rhizobiaceae bacterium]|nr:pseudouridine synthase [Rhizobiaceae bacterium]
MGYGSRREIQLLGRQGRVTLDGAPVSDVEARVTVTPDLAARMVVDGEALDPPPGMVLLLHKPLGVTCSHKEAGPLVYGLFPPRWRRREPGLSTVGRLDKETSGLLLLTDDGALLHRIISPKSHVAKRYRVTLDRPLRGDEAETFAAGTLMLDGEDKPLLPAEMRALSPMAAEITLREGRYHQVRRMFAAVGNHVVALHRDRMGGLDLPESLAPGAYSVLDEDGIATIFAASAK